jgi:hypothetical protein
VNRDDQDDVAKSIEKRTRRNPAFAQMMRDARARVAARHALESHRDPFYSMQATAFTQARAAEERRKRDLLQGMETQKLRVDLPQR